jgi:hypothetical protein
VCGGQGGLRPDWTFERIEAEIRDRENEILREEDEVRYWEREVKEKKYLYDQGDFPGRSNENNIVRLNEEIRELRSWR